MSGLRETALASKDARRRRLVLPEWEIVGYVHTWSGMERSQVMQAWRAWRDAHGGETASEPFYRAFIVAHALRDEDGNRIFLDSDVIAIANRSSRVIDVVIYAVDQLNGITDAEAERILKNSEAPAGPKTESGTSSPSS